MLDPNDGGRDSRKYRALYAGIIVIGLASLAAVWAPGYAPTYSTLVGGVVGLYALYAGSNVAAKHVIGKINNAANPTPEEPVSDEPDAT